MMFCKRLLRDDFLRLQGNCCGICKTYLGRKDACLDHDHEGGYRGTLCNGCNLLLGLACDSPELLRRAAKYLELPRIARFPRLPRLPLTKKQIENLKKGRNSRGRNYWKKGLNMGQRIAWALPRTKRQLETCNRNIEKFNLFRR